MVIICDYLPPITWCEVPNFTLESGVTIFRIPIASNTRYAPGLRQVLHPEEVLRASRYHRAEDQHRFTIARASLRILLGNYTGLAPTELSFAIGTNKKPLLRNAAGLHYNISHSGDWILIAVSPAEIGIDVEKVDAFFPFQEILPYNFSQQEKAAVEKSPLGSRVLFYRLWTRKEAFVKATARGIDADFHNVPALDGRHYLTSSAHGPGEEWTISSFEAEAGYAAAIAYATTLPASSLRFYELGQDCLPAYGAVPATSAFNRG